MSGIETGVLGFGVMLLMLGLRMPIGAAMFLTGVGGYVVLAG